MSDPWFRTTDMLRWGAANSGGNLTAVKFDENNWYWLQRVRDLETMITAGAAVGIDDITLSGGNELTFTMTDYSTHAITLPTAYPNQRGEWVALTNYSFFDWFTYGGSLYQVLIDHTSPSVFDPGSSDIILILQLPSNILPAGGATGMALVKVDGTDYNVQWLTVSVPTGGVEGQIIRKNSGTDYDYGWGDDDAVHTTALDSSGAVSTVQEILDDLAVNSVQQADIDAAIATSEASTATAIDVAIAAATVGTHDLWLPITLFTPRTTNGGATGTAETASNKNMIRTLDFDATTQEFAQYDWVPPKSWDLGTFTYTAYWSHAATTVNFGVAWGLDAVALSNDDPMDVAFGTSFVVTDTGGTTNDLYITAASGNVVIAGTPALADMIMLRIHRDPANGSDTMAIDARLHGIKITYTATAAIDD